MSHRGTSISRICAVAVFAASGASAAPVTYGIDSDHTFPSFEADHLGGLSTWRGKFNRTSGSIVLDREAGTGSLEVTIETASIDFGHDELNEHARSAEMFDAGKYPTAVYSGKLARFENGAPTAIEGTLTLHGVAKPLTLTIDRFLCKQHPFKRREVCGANATGTLDREAFGIDWGKSMGFDMQTRLEIQVEALREGGSGT